VLTDAGGLPLAVAVSTANTHDSLALIPLVQAIPAIRSRRGPRRRRPGKLHADKGYETRAMTIRICAPGCADGGSPRASPAAAWRPPPGWAANAGSSNAPSPG
jgi:Transposase DDE domain